MEFDYPRAWKELIVPELEKVPAPVIAVVNSVLAAVKDRNQGADLDIYLTETVEQQLESIPESGNYGGLGGLARLVNDYGHWRPGAGLDTIGIKGTAWKFSNLADQVLRTRLSLERDNNYSGRSFAVHEGILRACYATKNSWMWLEIGPATPELLAWSEAVVSRDVIEDEVLRRLAQRRAPVPQKWKPIVNPMAYGYVTAESETAKLEREFAAEFGDLAYAVRIRAVEYRVDGYHNPHPFCIGNKHMQKSEGMYLDPDAANCDICDRPNSAHHSVDGLWVWVGFDAKAEVPKRFRDVLAAIKPRVDEAGLAGVAMPRLEVPEALR